MTVAVIIPAYNPDDFLIDFAKGIIGVGLKNIIVVDDGSDKKFASTFDILNNLGCIVIHHRKNIGKGASIKYGIKKATLIFSDLKGCITAEANNQHTAEDIIKVYNAMIEHPSTLIMGVRKFNRNNSSLKFRTSFFFSKIYFRLITKSWHKDTRTILRGIPKAMFELALETQGNRYEYELNFFINVVQQKLPYYNVRVQSNLSKRHISHFRPFIDTILLFETPIKFATTSLSCYMVDLILFSIMAIFIFPDNAIGLLASTVIARVISGTINFVVNKKWSFGDQKKWTKQFLRYIILFVIQMTLSWLLVTAFSDFAVPITIVKMIVDLVLFVMNYFAQKNWVFKTK